MRFLRGMCLARIRQRAGRCSAASWIASHSIRVTARYSIQRLPIMLTHGARQVVKRKRAMSTEPLEATSLDDLGEVTFTIDIPRPDGHVVRVRLRTLTDAQVWEIRNSITWPSAPIRDIKRIEGEITPVYDYGNADYLKSNRK